MVHQNTIQFLASEYDEGLLTTRSFVERYVLRVWIDIFLKHFILFGQLFVEISY
tara:strand:+ start:104 stop:265 length:162 start_codon:yes stop_codon:yes gene_type:complete